MKKENMLHDVLIDLGATTYQSTQFVISYFYKGYNKLNIKTYTIAFIQEDNTPCGEEYVLALEISNEKKDTKTLTLTLDNRLLRAIGIKEIKNILNV